MYYEYIPFPSTTARMPKIFCYSNLGFRITMNLGFHHDEKSRSAGLSRKGFVPFMCFVISIFPLTLDSYSSTTAIIFYSHIVYQMIWEFRYQVNQVHTCWCFTPLKVLLSHPISPPTSERCDLTYSAFPPRDRRARRLSLASWMWQQAGSTWNQLRPGTWNHIEN